MTVVLPVAADGQKLPPFLIFQAKKDGDLARRYNFDRDGSPEGVSVAYQESAWMPTSKLIPEKARFLRVARRLMTNGDQAMRRSPGQTWLLSMFIGQCRIVIHIW